jgi:hypothetical protein
MSSGPLTRIITSKATVAEQSPGFSVEPTAPTARDAGQQRDRAVGLVGPVRRTADAVGGVGGSAAGVVRARIREVSGE